MKQFFLLLILIIIAVASFGQSTLPKGMTEHEKLIWDDYIKNYQITKDANPPAEIPRTPAEFEEMQGVVITWASYTSNLREIVRFAKESVKVYIVCSSASSVQSYLSSGGVTLENIEFVEANYNSVWVRDYGPQSVYLQGTNELAFVDWVYNRPRPADDVIPSVMANYLDIPIYQMTNTPNRLTATGGNFMTDGFNRGFSSNLILTENNTLSAAQIDTIKKHYMGIDPYVKMTVLPYDGIHHIDMHMKLLDEETLLVGQYPSGISDGPQIETNLNYILSNYQTPYGRPYKVVRIPMPADESGQYPNQYSDYLTYTNATILNNVVLVPIYGLSTDNEALQIYRSAMPGYQVYGINMRNVIPASGAIHCITREIAANDPIFIAHPSLRDTIEYSEYGFTIHAQISSASGISEATLFWSTDTTQGFNQATMRPVCSTYDVTIPSQALDGDIFYYISATNGNGKTIHKPLVAPAGLYRFYARGSGLGFDFVASETNTTVDHEIEFTFINQDIEVQSYVWNFGEGATPNIATTEGPHSVSYSTTGNKTISLTINNDLVLTKTGYVSVFQPTYHSLTVSVNGNGSVSPEIGEHQIVDGDQVPLLATPETNWQFSKWVVNDVDFNENPFLITVNENVTAVAYFNYIGGIESQIDKNFRLYPNPANNEISIEKLNDTGIEEIQICNLTGTREVLRMSKNAKGYKIDVSNLKSGIYFITIKNHEEISVLRFVKM